ncbi:hypothetical protein BU23DRAFT_602460 [Bimuria novae-zelandiae CBS 107.79]|uniref:MYND-type domain-containing protein n=1 Tax=Bimuria novae-zelandiae CBS 107.79 TaxID=1447943 RepID=A0A6A5UTH8_9PLEO|nr:hypothetical protein BU23DRAFT_602460 [Bimuria novae-zelandiae CBS 107.79]
MSLKHNFIVDNPYFYPVGNTPPVCLTQNLPPDRDAAVLLLGCGDIRNILFTAYAGAGFEVEILARNIVALTLITDDANATNHHLVWNIYYHAFFDDESHAHLSTHARKLLQHSDSIETWSAGPYGHRIRFCDSTTLKSVVKLWKLYAVGKDQDVEYNALQEKLQNDWKNCQQFANQKGSTGFLNAVRSVAPLVAKGLEASKGYESFWKTGKIPPDGKTRTRSKIANPMFAHIRSNQVLHYGTDPLLGFHLAAAFVRFSADSPLEGSNQSHGKEASSISKIAQQQFKSWCKAFRNIASKSTIRFAHADAIAFCHVLQYHRKYGESVSAYWYRSAWNFDRLVLDAPDYQSGTVTPTAFNVIDTSNLMDHLGSLNLLTAAGPLLVKDPSSTLRTEMLIPKEGKVSSSAKVLLCGDLATHATLLGLHPAQHWTNSTASWNVQESTIKESPALVAVLSRHIVLWKPAEARNIRFELGDLTKLVLKMYLNMFQEEGIHSRLAMLGQSKELVEFKLNSFESYTRASLCAILHRIRAQEMADWDPFIERLVKMILDDHTLIMGPHYGHTLHVHLSTFALSQLRTSTWFHPPDFGGAYSKFPSSWKDLPPILCVTLVVPHKNIKQFRDFTQGGNGTPIVHAMLQSPVTLQQCIYPDVQLGFGTVTASGTPFTHDYTVSVQKDESAGPGTSPLIVSFMASTSSLALNGGKNCKVSFALKNNAANSINFVEEFGVFLELYNTTIGSRSVFVTKFSPNLDGHLALAGAVDDALPSENRLQVAVRPYLDPTMTRVSALEVHYGITDSAQQDQLRDRANAVVFTLSSPFVLEVKIGDVIFDRLKLAFPLDSSRGKGKIARKSSWIEYTAPVMETKLLGTRSDSIFVAGINDRNEVSLEHLHYVHPDVLPTIHVGKNDVHAKWICMVTDSAVTMSENEYSAYGQYLRNNAMNKPGRFGVKESIYNMVMNILGINGFAQSSTFTLKSSAGSVATIFVHKLRMDLSNQTVFLDAAVVLLHSGNEAGYQNTVQKFWKMPSVVVQIDDDEAPFWKQLLPLFAERCRTWKHKPSCEYLSKGKIPLSNKLLEQCACSCGLGIFPEGYLKNDPYFRSLSQHAVRVAIPVIYSSPFGNDDVLLPSSASSSSQSPAPSTTMGSSSLHEQVMAILAKKNKCFHCGTAQAKNGKALMKCARCKFAQYCSTECQLADWKKEHKQLCNLLKGMSD